MLDGGWTAKRAPARTTVLGIAIGCACALMLLAAGQASARVWRVGSFNGKASRLTSIQAALKKAKAGDWILIGPGDYKEEASLQPKGSDDSPAALLIEKSGVHIRGMERNGVVIDGTKAGSPRCSSISADQNLGPLNSEGDPEGRNGVEVWKARGSSSTCSK